MDKMDDQNRDLAYGVTNIYLKAQRVIMTLKSKVTIHLKV